MNNKERIELRIKLLTEKNKKNFKKYEKKFNDKWKKQPYGEFALLKAELKGYKLAEGDLK